MLAVDWLWRGLRRFLVSFGVAAWILLVALVTLATVTNFDLNVAIGADQTVEMKAAAAIGVLLIGIVSICVLRARNRLSSFALVIAFGALLLAYGVGAIAPLRMLLENTSPALLAAGGAAALACIVGAGAVRSWTLGYAIAAATLVAPLFAVSAYALAGNPNTVAGAYAPWEILFALIGVAGGVWLIASVAYGIARARHVPEPRM